jgi:hypothetical protein
LFPDSTNDSSFWVRFIVTGLSGSGSPFFLHDNNKTGKSIKTTQLVLNIFFFTGIQVGLT